MENYFNNDSQFYVIPEDIEKSSVFELLEMNENYCTIYNPNFISGLSKNDEIEIFVNSKNGIIYFKTKVENTSDTIITFINPEEYKLLQRRENERILINENITIENEDKSINSKIIDLSAGGMKIESNEQLSINCEYSTKFNFDNIQLEPSFIPTRISFENSIYQISGQLNFKKSTDRIELVQYCYRKAFEQSNR